MNYRYIDKLKEKNNAVAAGDTEFFNKLSLPPIWNNFEELKKISCEIDFVLVQLAQPDTRLVTTYEHPDVGANLLPTWKGDCVFSDYLGFNEVDKPIRNQNIKTFRIAYLFYYSGYDIFGLFKNADTRLSIAKQLIGGRVIREKSFPNHLRTSVFIEVPVEDKKGNIILEVQEIAIKLYDAKGYTPSGVSGLNKTLDSWGVPFQNKKWLQYFDITNLKKEYLNTSDMVKVKCEDGSSQYTSKHDITVAYASNDGLLELFDLYEAVHNQGRNTLDKMGYNDYDLQNLGTIGNMANQVGVAACLKGLGLDMGKEGQTQLSKYLYASSSYSLLDNNHYSIGELLNIDGGFCKSMKPTYPVIKDITVDNDLSGAYAGTMASLPYCIGVPCVISYPKDRENRINFKKQYDKLTKKNQLYPGAWVARVTTIEPLSFKQDLIFSKIFGATDFEKSTIEDDEGFFQIEDSKIPSLTEKGILVMIPDGSFQLLNNEIISGILTHDILQFIFTYWKPSEQKEFFQKLRLDSMIFYHNDFYRDAENFKKDFEKLDDELKFNFDKGISIRDSRKPVWTIIPTDKGWIGDLVKIRSDLKDISSIAKTLIDHVLLTEKDLHNLETKVNRFLKLPNLNDDDKNDLEFILTCVCNKEKNQVINISKLNDLALKYKCQQNSFKCVNNSTYGVTGSGLWQTEKPSKNHKTSSEYGRPKIGNMVFAQNITARVRLGSYCMMKSSNGYAVITDGTQSNLNEYWYWRWENQSTGHRFGADELWRLSRFNESSKVDPKGRFEVRLQPLCGKKWEVIALNENNQTVTISNGEIEITGKEEKWGTLDNLMYEHSKSLFGELDIFQNDVMKYSSKDVYKGAAFQSQANYLFEKFFETDKDVFGKNTKLKIKARGYNLSKKVHSSPDLSDEGFTHPYEEMIIDIYNNDDANIYLPRVYSMQLLGIDDFNKTENATADYNNRGFLPHSPYYRSSRPSPFSLSMFRWNTRRQYEMWSKRVNGWKNTTGFGIELLFLTKNIIENKEKLKYSEVVNKVQKMIDDEGVNQETNSFTIVKLDEKLREKLKLLRHPQYVIDELLSCLLTN